MTEPTSAYRRFQICTHDSDNAVTDDELLNRLAEIEGVQKGHSNYPALKNHFVKTVNEGEWLEGERIWNPLTDNADAFALIEKYHPDIFWSVWYFSIWLYKGLTKIWGWEGAILVETA